MWPVLLNKFMSWTQSGAHTDTQVTFVICDIHLFSHIYVKYVCFICVKLTRCITVSVRSSSVSAPEQSPIYYYSFVLLVYLNEEKPYNCFYVHPIYWDYETAMYFAKKWTLVMKQPTSLVCDGKPFNIYFLKLNCIAYVFV